MNIKLVKKMLGTLAGHFLILGLAFGFAWASSDNLYTYLRLFDRIALTVADRYVSQVDAGKMVTAGITGMLDKLDPYSRYLTDKEFYYLMKETQGEYVGIGVDLESHSDTVWINAVIENSPAFKGGIRTGDRIIRIDDTDVIGRSRSDCRNLLIGESGSQVTLKIWRPLMKKSLDITLARSKIHIEAVPCRYIDNDKNGYIKIARFSEGCVQEVKAVLENFIANQIRGVVIDLRGNPGGLLVEAVECAALFLDKDDKIVETRGRGSAAIRSYEARENGILNKGPLVIVIDDQTASAAEIVAGAIQDNDRGIIIGTASFGKGLVQQIMQFDNNSALKLTTAKYYTPSRRCIQKDSLKGEIITDIGENAHTMFHTDSGRPVFGGGGIIPDIYVDKMQDPPLLEELNTLGYITDFVIEKSDNLKIDENFAVGDDLVKQFFEYIKERGYQYHNTAYQSFNRFLSENDNWIKDSRLAPSLDEISGTLEKRSQDEMYSLTLQVKERLYESFIEIALDGNQSYELIDMKHDPSLLKASEVIKDLQTYRSYLANY
jgi:carboxyl-terminal processing protease